tara:strand:- start:10325 stop:11383 length:1059 start_codon:yes stop_codon:yes gene_type:complete
MIKSLSAIQLGNKPELVVDEIDIADPVGNQVMIKLISSGICHSQLHQMHDSNLPKPLLLGHEATGVVMKAGPECSYVKEGDYVIATWVRRNPIKGRYLPSLRGVSYQEKKLNCRITFTWSEIIVCEDEYVVKIPKKYATPESCIVGCSILTGAGAVKNTAKVIPGETVAVFGVGGVGLAAVKMASLMKASKIIAVDIDNKKLEFSKQFGVTHTINSLENNPINEIIELTDGGVDYAFDAIGKKNTINQIIEATKQGGSGASNIGGTSILIGLPDSKEITLDPNKVLLTQKIFKGSLGATYPEEDFNYFLEMYEKGDFPIDKMISETFDLSEINKACLKLESGEITGRSIIKF